ncbi:MAG: NfeD family protein [Clostridiales bacterium]|nr:NfeD family protein [Clostridiales bacterium]
MNSYLILWIVVGLIFLVVDVVTSTFLFIWFSIGAIAAIIANMLGFSIGVQTLTFIFVSALFTAVGYPLMKNTIKKTVAPTPTTEKGYIGREFTIEEDINEKATIKFDGIYWTFKNEGEPIKKGDKIKITGIEGNKLLVKKI